MLKDCSHKCVSKKHADELTRAIIEGFNFEEQVIPLLQTCHNVSSNKDSMGRTALQVAATYGRVKILSWLLSHDLQPQIHAKDDESGYSALHRAFFYGQLQAARILLKNSSSLNQPIDYDGMSPFDHLTQDVSLFKSLDPLLPCEVYVWGSNSNYLLGLEKQSSAEFPELLDAFPKQSKGVIQVAMSKFHSVFVSSTGEAYSCGIGQGGKLGHGSEATVISPTKINIEAESSVNNKIKKSTVIIQAAVGLYHSVLLTDSGNVLTFGMNQYHQLGLSPPPTQLLAPKFLKNFKDKGRERFITGICASRFHSVFWCSDGVYTCGLNAGALGHLKGEKTIIEPRKVPSFSTEAQNITLVVASEGATAIATSVGDVYVLHEFQCRKIASKQVDLAKIFMRGGMLDFLEEDFALDATFQILLLSRTGKITIWSQTNPILTRCSFGNNNQLIVKDIALSQSSMVILSKEGEAFIGTLSSTPRKKIKESNLSPTKTVTRLENSKREPFTQLYVKRIPGIYRGNTIVCDPVGKNFAVTHVHPAAALEEDAKIILPPSKLQPELKQLLQEADPCDLTHDIIFQVGSHEFAAHRFILSTNCYGFYRETVLSSKTFEDDNKTVRITHQVQSEVFKLLLEFVYTGTCALFTTEISVWKFIVPVEAESEAHLAEKTNVKDNKKWKNGELGRCEEILRSVEAHARKFSVLKLAEILGKAQITSSGLMRTDNLSLQPKSWNRMCGSNFFDTTLLSQDGKEFNSHRVVLAARSDYFRSMFGYVWIENETSRAIPLPIHSSVLEVVLDYIYEDKATKIQESEDVDWISNCLVVGDLLLIPRLICICEAALVRLLTVKNVGKVLEFAFIYNAVQLKTSSMYFICNNLPAVVELRVWNCLSEESMNDLSKFYQKWNPKVGSRLPTLTTTKTISEELMYIEVLNKSFGDITISPGNEEKDGKRKRPRRKTGKKSTDIKGILQSESLLSSENIKPGIESTAKKEDSWCKVDKSRRRYKSLSQETPSFPKLLNEASEKVPEVVQPKELKKDDSLPIELDPDARDSEHATSKQSNLTLLDMATVIQATLSPINQNSKKFRKLSQKQRKQQNNGSLNDTPILKPTSSLVNDSPTSKIEPNSPSKVVNAWGSQNIDNAPKISFAQTMETEKNTVPLQEIIIKEKTQQKNLIETSTRPLRLTQMEEKAMDELRIFYGCDIVDDEYIVVERVVPLETAAPTWSKKTPNPKIRSFSLSDK